MKHKKRVSEKEGKNSAEEKELRRRKKIMKKMKPLLIELLLIVLTVCASSTVSSTNAPLEGSQNEKFSSQNSQPEEIRLNITLKSDENEKEHVDIDMGKYL